MAPRLRASARKELMRDLEGWLWISPWLLGMLLFIIGPMIISFYWSFTNYQMVLPPKWVGLRNYADMLQDPLIAKSLINTFYFAFVSVPLGLFLGLLLALIVNQNVRGISFWRTVYYLPAITAVVAYAQLWRYILHREWGALNNFLLTFGIIGPNWFSPKWVIPAFIMMSLWTVGGSMIINLAGLQSIPTEMYDAAKVDGAAGFRLLRHITLPMMSPIIFYNLVMGIIAAMQSFTSFFVLLSDLGYTIQAPPGEIGLIFMVYLYRNAFWEFRMGYGSAMAWVLFVIILVMTLLVFRSSSSWVHYAGESRS
ncbi:MAG: sugar ABC transporter permease [Anaerolineae bacterium]|nr:sugar ABC transporter permease [Anaerolineae bacterium]